MNRRRALSILLLAPIAAHAGLVDDWLKQQLHQRTTNELDADTAAAGLKQALELGTQKAVTLLGRENGYFGNTRVKIPMPDSLARTEKLLRKVGQDQVADDFVLSLNRAAEAAAPEAKAIFVKVIREMSVQDAVGIVRGADNAATTYFRDHSEADLRAKFRPIVSAATDKVGVTRRYKKFLTEAGPIAMLVHTQQLDIDEYVTNKALDGLFLMVADEERRIRQDPVARTTELLRKVFGR